MTEVPEVQTTRRAFHVTVIYGLWGLVCAALGVPALTYLFWPPKLSQAQEWVEAGDVSQLRPDEPVEMAFRVNRVDGWKVSSQKNTAWVVKKAGGQVIAFGPQCTHLGCAYHWDDARGEFLCPCHSSVFSLDGRVVSGPAPRPLDRYDVRIENHQLKLGALRQEQA